MKRMITLLMAMLAFAIPTTFAGLFPSVDKPNSPDASMIALQFGVDVGGGLTTFMNSNWSMWTPVVKMEDGSQVEFRWFTGGADMTAVYYKENLVAGKYTLVGFNYVYTDYGKLHEAEKAKGGDIIPSKNPYNSQPYHVIQFYALEEPLVFDLEANKIITLGNYAVKYKLNGGMGGTTDDRYRSLEEHTKIVMVDAEDQSLLSYMKPWATKKWKMWNAKNPASK